MPKPMLFCACLVGLGLAQTLPRPDPAPGNRDSNRSVLVFIAQKLFDEETFESIRLYLHDLGYAVRVAAPDTSLALSMDRGVLRPDLALARARPEDFAALVLVDGSGIVLHWDDSLLHARCREFLDSGRVVAAIGVAPICLARAGVLKGRRATVFRDQHALQELRNRGARHVWKPVVTDGRVVTASGGDDSRGSQVRDFVRSIVKVLEQSRPNRVSRPDEGRFD